MSGSGGGTWAVGEDYAFAYDCPSFSDRVLCLTTGTPPSGGSAAPPNRTNLTSSSSSSSILGAISPSGSFDDVGEMDGSHRAQGSLQAKRRKTMRQSLGGEDAGASAEDNGSGGPVPPSPSRRNPMVRTAKRRFRAATATSAQPGEEQEDLSSRKTPAVLADDDEGALEETEPAQEETEEGCMELEEEPAKRRKSNKRGAVRNSLSEQEAEATGDEPVATVRIHVSGLLLAAKSRFFRSLFASGMKETNQKEVWLQLSKEELKPVQDIIRFIYEGKLQSSSFREQLEVLITADKFDVPSAVDAASKRLAEIEFTLEQCEEVLSLIGSIQSCPSLACLITRCQEVLYEQFGDLDKVWDQEDFWQLSPAAFSCLLDYDKCGISCENDVFHILRAWVEEDDTRESHLDRILPTIRWPMMDSNFLNDIVAQTPWLQNCSEFQMLHREALIWLSFSNERREMDLTSNSQLVANKRYHPRPPPAEMRKKLRFTWSPNLRDGAKLYTSPSFLFSGYYFYCELSKEGDKIGFFICINQRPSNGEDEGDDSMRPCFVHFRALANVLNAGTGDVVYSRKGTGMFTSLNDGWGWYDFLDSCTWEELKTRDFMSPSGSITFSVKLELKKNK